jgi:hypothetical protein
MTLKIIFRLSCLCLFRNKIVLGYAGSAVRKAIASQQNEWGKVDTTPMHQRSCR